jgi:hypothetical protein
MKNDYICFIIIILFLGIGLGSCRAKKNIQRVEEASAGNERIERVVDTARTVEISTETEDIRGSEIDQIYTKITDYDSTGTVIRRVSEEWRNRQSADMAIRDRRQGAVSVTGKRVVIEERDTSHVLTNEITNTDTDSRLIQGTEWIWVILSITLILAVIIYMIYNKINL